MVVLQNETYFEYSNEFVGQTIVTNFILDDKRISYKAQGIYLQIIRFQNSQEHKIYVKGLMKLKKDGKDSVSAGINELLKFGYLLRQPIRNEKGQMQGYKYVVFQKPLQPQEVKPETENPVSVNPVSENPQQISKISKVLNSLSTTTTVMSLAEAKEHAQQFAIKKVRYKENLNLISEKIKRHLRATTKEKIENYVLRLLAEHDKKPRKKPISKKAVRTEPRTDEEMKELKGEVTVAVETKITKEQLEAELKMFKKKGER